MAKAKNITNLSDLIDGGYYHVKSSQGSWQVLRYNKSSKCFCTFGCQGVHVNKAMDNAVVPVAEVPFGWKD